MKNLTTNDVATYREKTFPGKGFLRVGIVAWGLWFLSAFIINYDYVPESVAIAIGIILTVCTIIYLTGFWRAVEGKGYHPVLWLASLTGPIGAIIILYFPDLSNGSQPDQVCLDSKED